MTAYQPGEIFAEEQTITVADVLAYSHVRLPFAERLAAYANHRAAGMHPADALTELGIEVLGNMARYERFLRQFRASRGLPDLSAPSDRSFTVAKAHRGGTSGRHQRWHVARGVSSPGCELCAADLQGAGQ